MDDQVRYYESKLQYEIDPWDLNEALERGDRVLLVDTRTPEAYGRSHIPGAVNIPHRTMSPTTTAHLDKGALIVTYCDGIRCNGSTKGALNDLWRFDGTNWAFVGGSRSANSLGNYGTYQVGATGNIPYARDSAAYLVDTKGNFWLFGGTSDNGNHGWLNDLWILTP